MKPIPSPDSHHYNAAVGWLELGNRTEARAELELISAKSLRHPAVLEVRWLIWAEEKQWSNALLAAQDIMAVLPGDSSGWLHCAYALRRVSDGGVDQAWTFLLPVAEKFPDEPVIAFNLACYACQLKNLDEARHWLKRAFEIGGEKTVKLMALADEDLKPLWDEIRRG